MFRIMKTMLKKRGLLKITAKGVSMLPFVREGDTVAIKEKVAYNTGDIIVFSYENQILMHRVVRKTADGYWAKGDNSFRIETVSYDKIIGAAEAINDETIKAVPGSFVKASLDIGILFIRNGFDAEQTKLDKQYLKYREEYLDV